MTDKKKPINKNTQTTSEYADQTSLSSETKESGSPSYSVKPQKKNRSIFLLLGLCLGFIIWDHYKIANLENALYQKHKNDDQRNERLDRLDVKFQEISQINLEPFIKEVQNKLATLEATVQSDHSLLLTLDKAYTNSPQLSLQNIPEIANLLKSHSEIYNKIYSQSQLIKYMAQWITLYIKAEQGYPFADEAKALQPLLTHLQFPTQWQEDFIQEAQYSVPSQLTLKAQGATLKHVLLPTTEHQLQHGWPKIKAWFSQWIQIRSDTQYSAHSLPYEIDADLESMVRHIENDTVQTQTLREWCQKAKKRIQLDQALKAVNQAFIHSFNHDIP